VQYTFDNILQNVEGRRLMAEMFYLYGCMLLLMDRLIIGQVRERIVVAYYRYKGGHQAIENLNQVIKLTKSTDFIPGENGKRPAYYPEEFFARYSFKSNSSFFYIAFHYFSRINLFVLNI
jgi:WASH complex subunit strumpellin